MNLYDYLLGSGTPTDSNLSLIQEYYEPHEIDHLELVRFHQAHLRDLDLSEGIEPPEGPCRRFPTIRLLPLNQLLKAIKSTRDPKNGLIWPPGSREFGKRLVKEAKALDKHDEPIAIHFQRLSTLTHSLLAAEQESVGIANEKLLIRLRYLPPTQALKAMEIDPFQNRIWSKGLERPTSECKTLVVRGEGPDSYHFALFNLIA